jgi:signal transduction histidine kinase
VAGDQAAACLAHPGLVSDPRRTQEWLWGLDQAAIARRLSQHWHLPRWLAVVVGYLGLPLETAKSLGAEPELFSVVQLAVRLAQGGDHNPGTNVAGRHPSGNAAPLHLAVGSTMTDATKSLGLSVDEAEACRAALGDEPPFGLSWEAPQANPLLCDLLALAADNRRLSNPVTRERWDRDADILHSALREQIAGEARRLQTQKLSALAEFAAGAGHEINNPLAVISGQAQYLLSHFRLGDRKPIADGAAVNDSASPSVWEKALQTIIAQTQRIHQVLTDLMQFARPPPAATAETGNRRGGFDPRSRCLPGRPGRPAPCSPGRA